MRYNTKHIATCCLAMSISTMALSVPHAVNGQVCTGNITVGCLRPGTVCSPVAIGGGPSGRCTTPGGLPKGEKECDCVGTPIPLIDPRCGDRTAKGKFDCTISQPPVNELETPIPAIVFAPGDKVQVMADGCVQTGGLGATWKRYVNPAGDNSDRLYHGLIRIPTGTKNSGLVRINSIIETTLTVSGAGVPVPQLVLSLGYEDDDYSDNGYDNHDDGTADQCLNDPTNGIDGGPAHVTITIARGVPPDPVTSRFNFDVLSATVDPNGLPFNPQWSWQQKNPGKIPDTTLCHNFSVRGSTLGIPDLFLSPSFPDCTDQADPSTVDQPTFPNSELCNAGTAAGILSDSFAGHVNWFPVTVEGTAGSVSHSGSPFPFGDDDYTFTFNFEAINGNKNNSLSVNGRDGLHVEFDSDETIDNFATKEWTDLKAAVDNNDTAATKIKFLGHTILTGMFGLDGEHGLKAELHPLYAMATRRDDFEDTASDEAWLIFVRNQGDEGYCSSQLWDSGFADYTFRLPWRPGMTSVKVDTSKTIFSGSPGTSGPTVVPIAPPASTAGVYATFHLGPAVHNTSVIGTPASVPFINGALHLIWTGPRVVVGTKQTITVQGRVSATPTNAPDAAEDEEDEPEDKLHAAVGQLTPAQQLQVKNAIVIVGTQAAVVQPLTSAGPIKVATRPPATVMLLERHALKAGAATMKLQRDTTRIRALCAATNNAPAGLPATMCGSK